VIEVNTEGDVPGLGIKEQLAIAWFKNMQRYQLPRQREDGERKHWNFY
jgi:hypothetical protein